MSATSTPYGLVPGVLSGGSPLGLIRSVKLTANTTNAFFNGCLVNVGAGVITPIVATPTTTRNGNSPTGIFVGVRYTDSSKRLIDANYFPANGHTSFQAYGPITIFMMDDPGVSFRVQASGAVALTDIGKNAALANFTGSTTNGNSQMQLDQATLATTATLAVRIIDITPIVGNTAGDAYTDVICIFNPGVHAYRNATGV